ncbi:MAG: glycosyltransferase family A protein [Thermoproteus sp.]
MKISIVVPSKGCIYIKYLLTSLRDQTTKPNEIVLVLKDCDVQRIEKAYSPWLNLVVVEQKEGYFTHALNLGKKAASGDIIIFTDDDAITPKGWIKKYIRFHRLYPRTAGISSRDIYIELKSMRIRPTPDDLPYVRIYRWTFRPLLERPHPLLKDYALGIYVTRDYKIAHGPCIPNRSCYSLPFRGVNMSFKAEYIYDIWFPEHPLLRRAPGNEQYFGLQLLLKGFNTIYVPGNPVLHIYREESLSRTRNRNEINVEYYTMKQLFREMLEGK